MRQSTQPTVIALRFHEAVTRGNTLSRAPGCKWRVISDLGLCCKNLKNPTVTWTQNSGKERAVPWGCVCHTEPLVGALLWPFSPYGQLGADHDDQHDISIRLTGDPKLGSLVRPPDPTGFSLLQCAHWICLALSLLRSSHSPTHPSIRPSFPPSIPLFSPTDITGFVSFQ